VLGCAGMADLAGDLSRRFGLPVVEGAGAAVKLVEMLATLGLRTSKIGGWASPLPKTWAGPYAGLATPR
ncbi:MAG: aspartate/glutamate racemase family protein, partial [Bauldia sp.]|nr:aspartate/glutamate racemase family protein [Bauldia sp.]